MPTYKLYYFNARGVGDVSRQLFALANQEYEDIRYTHEEWPQHKAETPFGQLPVLEVDGKKLAQSAAINRYLARKFGFAGKTPFDEAQVDAIADQIRDLFTEVGEYFYVLAGRKPGDLEKLKNEVLIPARDKHFPILNKILLNNKTGFLHGDSVTWADVFLAHFFSIVIDKIPDVFNASVAPELTAHQKKIHSIPAIAKWIQIRPVTDN